MSPLGWLNDQPLTLTIGPGPNGEVIVIGAQDTNLTNYYQLAFDPTTPYNVLSAVIFYDGNITHLVPPEYYYEALISSPTPSAKAYLVTGRFAGGNVIQYTQAKIVGPTADPDIVFTPPNGFLIQGKPFQAAPLQIGAAGAAVPSLTVDRNAVLSFSDGTHPADLTVSRFSAGRLALGVDNALDYFASAAGTTVVRATVNGEGNARYFRELSGKEHWGPGGASPQDTVFYRAGVATLAADAIKANNNGAAETWTGMTLLNGFNNRGAGFAPASYRAVPSPANGVELVGQVTAGGGSGTVMATLAAGYHPTSQQPFWAYNNTANTPLLGIVETNGNVELFGGTLAAGNVCQFRGVIPRDL